MGKRTFLFILALLPCFLLSTAKTSADLPTEGQPIVIDRPDHIQPRTIKPECYYLDGHVYIICNSSITSVDATVTRLSDNTEWSDSSLGNTLRMAVSSNAGTYLLVLTLSDGSTWYGEYTL